jgi:hypothetical protein
MTLKAPIEARTWGLITQPHTVMRPTRHRRPSLIPGAHQVSRKGDEGIMGETETVGIREGEVFAGNEWDQGVGRGVARVYSTSGQFGAAPHPYPLPVRNGERGASAFAPDTPHPTSLRSATARPSAMAPGVRRSKSPFRGFSCAPRTTSHPTRGEAGRPQRYSQFLKSAIGTNVCASVPFAPCGRRWPSKARSDEGCFAKVGV